MSESIIHQQLGDMLLIKVNASKFTLEESEKIMEVVYTSCGGKESISKIILNIEKVEQIRSAGLAVIGRLGLDFTLRMVKPNENIRRLIGMMGFMPNLNFYDTEKEALEGN